MHTAFLTVTSPLNTVIVPVNVTISNSAGYFDFDGDGVNIGDVQTVAAHIPSDDSDAAFNHRHDIDRDTDIDATDGQLIAQQWTTLRDCCGTDYPMSTSLLHINAPAAIKVGQSFTVDILIDDPQSLGGFEFDLTFDPTLLEVESVTLGTLLSSTGRSSSPLGPLTDNTNGLIAFGGYSYGNKIGITNNGIIATITFNALAGGNSTLSIQQHLLADANGTPSLANTEDTTFTIKGGDEGFLLYLPTIAR